MTRERARIIHVVIGLWRKDKKEERNQNRGTCCYELRFLFFLVKFFIVALQVCISLSCAAK